MYLRHVNLIHNDLERKNILVKHVSEAKTLKATIIDYDISQLAVNKGFLVTKKLVSVNGLSASPSRSLCTRDNKDLSKKIFRSITGIFPSLFGADDNAMLNALLEIFRLVARTSWRSERNQSKMLEKLKEEFRKNYENPEATILKLPTVFDVAAAKGLLNLLEFMVLISDSNKVGCTIPVEMLAPTPIVEKIKQPVKQ
ncbi:hypothetical protein BDF19DRAFT_444885 [Syncephalis fuscata]|nr:hypothetical protein BDF19DRAFT_444885 [Syncephalis fuscata]